MEEISCMFIISRSPVIRVLVPYALSLVAGLQGKLDPSCLGLLITSVLLLILQWLIYHRGRSGYHPGTAVSVLSVMIAVVCGLASGIRARPADPALPCAGQVILCGNISGNPEMRDGRMCFDLKVRMLAKGDSILSVRTGVKVYVPWPGEDHAPVKACPEQGSCILMRGTLVPIENAGNPGEVDYETILQRKDTWYRFYAEGLPRRMEVRAGANAASVRERISAAWSGRERSVQLLQAICLGDQSELASWVREDYSRAGAMHILAVSGLHVGLIWWVLNRMLFFLSGFYRSVIPKTILIVLLLWAYAWLTGFSSSVCRSVCMFSLFSLASLAGRKSTSVNTVLLSMMLLLLIQPGRILEAGFQLSYCAVLSIVGFMPMLRNLVKTRCSLLNWIWEASMLSLAAQLGTLPLAIYYFHRIPLYGMLSNLITLPMLTLIVSLFVVSVPLALIPSLAILSGKGLVGLTTIMDMALSRVASLPAACLEGQHMEEFMVLMYFLLLCSTGFFISSRKVFPLVTAVFSISVLLVFAGWRAHRLQESSFIQVSHFRGASLVSLVEAEKADHYIWCEDAGDLVFLDAYIVQAWSPSSYEHSVMLLSPGDTLSRQGGISMCFPLAEDCWLLGNGRCRMAVVRGTVPGTSIACLEEHSLEAILFSDLKRISGALSFTAGPGAPELLMDGSNSPYVIEKTRQLRKRIISTKEQGAYVFPF